MIGLKFYPNKVIHALIKELPSPKWSERYNMVYLPNNQENLTKIFHKFKGAAWINCNHFFPHKPLHRENESLDINAYRKRKGTTWVPDLSGGVLPQVGAQEILPEHRQNLYYPI